MFGAVSIMKKIVPFSKLDSSDLSSVGGPITENSFGPSVFFILFIQKRIKGAAMEKVLIIGSNGAGKSTFSFALAERVGLPLYHLDQIYWHGYWEVVPRDQFLQAVDAIVSDPKWIIEGNNLSSLHRRVANADTVFWFELHPLRCIFNVIKRELKYRGAARPDMPQTCISRIDLRFLKTVWQFNKKNR